MFTKLQDQIKNLDIFKAVYEDLDPIKKLAGIFKDKSDVLVFGTGGSSLGGKALTEFKAGIEGKLSKVHFVENVDARSFLNTLSKCERQKTGVIAISKSGRTTETLSLLLTFEALWQDFDFRNNAIVITENSENNDLRAFAEEKGSLVTEHNRNIGGRFSVFSVVGLLPAVVGGVDIDKFILGARNLLAEVTDENCKIYTEIKSLPDLFSQGINEHVIFSYSDFMAGFGRWGTQLISESLGKRADFGITPIAATGTIDQHSMLQLFLGGQNNKYYTVITQKNGLQTPKISSNLNTNVINSLKGHTIADLMNAHQKATIDVLKQKAHVRGFEFPEINEEVLGYMMMLFVVETIGVANLLGLNPFDQPAVEESKRLAMKYLAE